MDNVKVIDFNDLSRWGSESKTRIDSDGEEDLLGDYIRTTEITENYDGNPYLTKVKVSVDKIIDGNESGYPVVMETLISDVE